MAELHKKLGKLSLAILENFVEGVLGEKFVDELRQPTDREIAIVTALGETESLFVARYDDRDLSQALFVDLKQADRPVLKDAVGKYFDHPTDPSLRNSLQQVLFSEFSLILSKERIENAVDFYLKLLTKELMLTDEVFRDNIAALSIVETRLLEQRQVELLEQIAVWTVQQQQTLTAPTYSDSKTQTAQLILDGDYEAFDETRRKELIAVLAALLHVDVQQIKVLRVSPGSIMIDLELEVSVLARLKDLVIRRDSRLAELGILALHLNTGERYLLHKTIILRLPQPPADFTGREDLIEQIIKDFEAHKGVAISGLTGMGGIGKTALGLFVAHKIAGRYPDGQIFLDLKGTTMPLSASEIARHVVLSLEPGMDVRGLDESNFHSYFQQVLNNRRVLLFFDNARSADQIAPLRPPETCALLVTSRWTFPVPGLKNHRVGVLAETEAQAFLLELCPRIEDKAAALAKACGYLPLALRIAGSFLQVNEDWSVEKYLARLNDRQTRLPTLKQSHTAAELQNTEPELLAAFEMSYNQLNAEDQRRWRMLGVFPTSFDWIAAGALWNLEEEETNKLLGLLKRYSLLEFDENTARYNLHDLLKDYALSQMKEDEDYEARFKHAAHYKDVLDTADDLYLEGDEKILLGLLLFDLEWENIRAGQAWVASTKNRHNDLAVLCVGYPDAGAYVLSLRQHPRENIQWLNIALSAARENGNRRGEGAALSNLGLAYAALGDARQAIEFYEQALIIDREIGDRRGEGAALSNLGLAYGALGDARQAIEFYEQALVLVREIGDRRGEGAALSNLGTAYAALGHARQAIEFYEQALVLVREIGDRRGEGNALLNMGLARYALEEKDQAIELVKQALKIYEAIESPTAEKARKQLDEWGN